MGPDFILGPGFRISPGKITPQSPTGTATLSTLRKWLWTLADFFPSGFLRRPLRPRVSSRSPPLRGRPRASAPALTHPGRRSSPARAAAPFRPAVCHGHRHTAGRSGSALGRPFFGGVRQDGHLLLDRSEFVAGAASGAGGLVGRPARRSLPYPLAGLLVSGILSTLGFGCTLTALLTTVKPATTPVAPAAPAAQPRRRRRLHCPWSHPSRLLGRLSGCHVAPLVDFHPSAGRLLDPDGGARHRCADHRYFRSRLVLSPSRSTRRSIRKFKAPFSRHDFRTAGRFAWTTSRWGGRRPSSGALGCAFRRP